MTRLGSLSPSSLQRAIPEVAALIHDHPEARDAFDRVREAIVVQRPEIAQTFDALEKVAADPVAVLVGLKTLREQSVDGGRLVFSNDQCTPEFMRSAATYCEVDEDGSVLVASVILFCDGCRHIFNIGKTWYGCTHRTHTA